MKFNYVIKLTKIFTLHGISNAKLTLLGNVVEKVPRSYKISSTTGSFYDYYDYYATFQTLLKNFFIYTTDILVVT